MTANLYITRSAGTFDVQQVRDWLDARADAFEFKDNIYEIADSPTYADLHYTQVLAGKSSRGTFVRIEPHEIFVENEGGTQSLRSAIDFLKWLASRYELRVRTGWSGEHDVTEALRVNGLESHYEERIRSTDLEWTRQLREVGFFSDLSYGHTSVSLDEARRDRPAADQSEIAAYLESGRLYRAGDALATSAVGDVLGPADVLTDGLYLWPAQLAAQVRDHHVRLPRHFLCHARANGFRVPSVDLAALPRSQHLPALTADELTWYTRPVEQQGDSSSLRVAHGLATTRTVLRSGSADAVYRGYTRRGTAVLVTMTLRHSDSYDDLVEHLRFDHPAIAPLLHIGASDPAWGQGFRTSSSRSNLLVAPSSTARRYRKRLRFAVASRSQRSSRHFTTSTGRYTDSRPRSSTSETTCASRS